MDSCENSNKKLMFFHIVKSHSKTKLSFFETQSIKNNTFEGLRIATTCIQVPRAPDNVLFALFLSQASFNLTNVYALD